MSWRLSRLMTCLLLLAALGVGCGPSSYLYYVTSQATKELAEAKTAGAEKHTPYEYWSAKTYLQMAREKAGEADFEIAVDYGKRALEMCRKSQKLLAERATKGTSESKPPPTKGK